MRHVQSNLIIFLENDCFNILIALDGGQYAQLWITLSFKSKKRLLGLI